MPMWVARQFYWASLFLDSSDPPMGGYYDRLVMRIGAEEARKTRESNKGFALAVMLLIARWCIICGIAIWVGIRLQ